MQTQIRRRKTWRLIRVFTVCFDLFQYLEDFHHIWMFVIVITCELTELQLALTFILNDRNVWLFKSISRILQSLLTETCYSIFKGCNSGFKMSRCMTKPTKWPVCPAKTQISLGIRPVWLEYAWRNLGSSTTHWAHSKDWSVWAHIQADLSLHGASQVILLVLSCCSSIKLEKKHSLWWKVPAFW